MRDVYEHMQHTLNQLTPLNRDHGPKSVSMHRRRGFPQKRRDVAQTPEGLLPPGTVAARMGINPYTHVGE